MVMQSEVPSPSTIFIGSLMLEKNYLVTGATSGIGLELSQNLLLQGHRLFIVGRTLTKHEASLLSWAEKNQLSSKIVWQEIDFSMPNGFGSLDIKSIPPLDGLVNSAGILSLCPLKLETFESLMELMNTNLIAPMELTRLLLKERKFKRGSSLVYLSSVNGLKVGAKGHSLYAASKAGISGFVMSLANELSNQNIRVNCVAPAMVRTGMLNKSAKILSSESFDEYGAQYPLGLGTSASISDLIDFLLSEKSLWITGQSIVIDGGYTLN